MADLKGRERSKVAEERRGKRKMWRRRVESREIGERGWEEMSEVGRWLRLSNGRQKEEGEWQKGKEEVKGRGGRDVDMNGGRAK